VSGALPGCHVTLARFGQLAKAYVPMLVTPAGIVISPSALQYRKALEKIETGPPGSVTSARFVQLSKA
jgi:hypothetical protein